MYRDLTKGSIIRGLLLFALPMIAGNLLQQLYNIADTLIVGQALGRNALAAVGSAYTLMTFLTSIFLGLSMGSGALFSIALGKKDEALLRSAVGHAFGLILAVTVVLNVLVYAFLDAILRFLQIPQELYGQMREYLVIIFAGLLATFLYNFFACLLRAAGNSVAPLCFLGVSAGLNIALDLLFVLRFSWGIAGAAAATVFSQYVSGIGLTVYTALRCRGLLPDIRSLRFDRQVLADILDMSLLTCAQQSAMNFGILLVQRLVDSFGPVTMAAFAAAVKIDSFAYLPVQDFGNAFSTFVAQNYGAGQRQRIRRGFRDATLVSAGFSALISLLVCVFAQPLMRIFVQAGEVEVLAAGVRYLRIEGACYVGIGCLFLLYGFYRAVKRPGMSVVLTVISLGVRVALAYLLAGPVGEIGIWQHAAVNDLGVINAHFDKRTQVRQFGRKYADRAYRWQDNIRTKAIEKLFPNYFTGFRNLHAPAAYRKRTFEEVWNAEPELLARTTAHRFRSAEDVNQWVCLWWQIASGQFAPFNTDNFVSCTDESTIDNLCRIICEQSHDMLCINDPEKAVDFDSLALRLRKAFESILPNKSGFEK